jgi:hypothetical protein
MGNHFGFLLAALSLVCLLYFHWIYRTALDRRLKGAREARRCAMEEMERVKTSTDFERKLDAFTQAVVTWKYGDLSHADRARLVRIVRRQSARRPSGN